MGKSQGTGGKSPTGVKVQEAQVYEQISNGVNWIQPRGVQVFGGGGGGEYRHLIS